MAEEIKALIEKIKQEGVVAAENKAAQIERQAMLRADEILLQARKEAEKITSLAQEAAAKNEQAQKALLAQAARDVLLLLRERIVATLSRLIESEVGDVLDPQALARIISELISSQVKQARDSVVVSISEKDSADMRGFFISRLKEEIAKGMVLKTSDGIQSGFLISFDSGKSQFDFSGKALADYIAFELKPKLAELLDRV